jgi:hypothetical protein
MKAAAKYISAILIILATIFLRHSVADDRKAPMIAHWYGDKKAAVSLRFDDSLDSHVKYAIPRLNQYGIKATFMVNPGKERYLENKDFWETQVPAMGHQLGNHTMHHHGAKTPAEADFEIGEVSRLLWKLYPNQSKLLVFASGGGAKWGGKDWEQASEEYKLVAKKYNLIDLYDGKHPAFSVRSKNGHTAVNDRVQAAAQRGEHLPILFHSIGRPGLKERIAAIYHGYDLNLPSEEFDKVLRHLVEMKDQLWIAPLADVLKYETECNQSRVSLVSRNKGSLVVMLQVGTDPSLYDQELTIIIPVDPGMKAVSVSQRANQVVRFHNNDRKILVNVAPVSGEIIISLDKVH